ncbi:MAG TPA: hypothetical protein VIX86_23120 [Streptosporangiaceae bacterium]
MPITIGVLLLVLEVPLLLLLLQAARIIAALAATAVSAKNRVP